MFKLIIWVPGRPLVNGPRRGKFEWSAPHQCYIYEGKEIEAAEFNAKYPAAIKSAHESRPQVRIIDAPEIAVSAAIEAPATIATLTVAREITIEEAEAVLTRLAPHRLKQKTGPKPKAATAA